MATYYKWRQSTVSYGLTRKEDYDPSENYILDNTVSEVMFYSKNYTVDGENIILQDPSSIDVGDQPNRRYTIPSGYYFMFGKSSQNYVFRSFSSSTIHAAAGNNDWFLDSGSCSRYEVNPKPVAGTFASYVYSTNSSAYPNDGVQGEYYYGSRTTVTSPTAPGNLTYPSPATTPTVTVGWGAATSNTDYPVDSYEVSYAINGGSSWMTAGTTAETSMNVTIPEDATSIQFRVRAKDSNGQWGEYQTGSAVAVYLTPNLTAPNLAMQGQNITINWTESLGATGYIVQRKSNTDGDWVQVYSGGALTFTEAVGPWSSVQYRVQAVFSGGTSGWATSAAIQVVSSSSLVISGQNGDLGTLVNDVPYTISTDTGNQITVKTTVNGATIFEGQVAGGTAKAIPVLDLVCGSGPIVIEATVQTSSGPVSAVRSWTYNKAAMTFPNAGCPSQLERNGKTIWPKTLAECVRIPGGRTLDQVMGFPAQAFYTTYTGTGTSGSGNQTHLAVPFKPQALAILDGNTGDAVLMVRPGTKVMNGNTSLTVAWSDTGVSWYSTNASNQLNATGTAYHVVVFG